MSTIATGTPDMFRATFSVESLTSAWDDVLGNDADDGVLSSGVLRFERDLDERLSELAEELSQGNYVPRDLTQVTIRQGAKERVLHVPAVRDRVVERALLEAITPLIDPLLGPASFAYRPGLGVDDAAAALVALREEGLGWVLRTDIDDCFPHLPVDMIRRRLSALIDDARVLAVVDALFARLAVVPGRGRRMFTGLPQGSAISPLLANLALVDLDDRLQEAGFPVIRYADDLAVATQTEADAWEAARVATAAVAELGMQMGADKTDVMSFDEGFSFLGIDFGPRYPPPLDEAGVREPDRKVLYVSRQGGRVRIQQGRLLVEDHTKTELLSVPTSEVGRMVCFGSVGVSAGARNWALGNDVDVVLASRRGNYLGTIVGDDWPSHCGRLRAQMALQNTPREVDLARVIVDAKITKQIAVLRRAGRRNDRDLVSEAVHHMQQMQRMLPDAHSSEELMGLEGAAASKYWPCFGSLFPDELRFEHRSRQPPMDVANSALSFLYTLLLGECVTALHAVGLHPGIGVLHSEQDRRPSLALDLMEEFRPLIVDNLVLVVARRMSLTATHGRTPSGKSGIWLTAAGREAVIAGYETRMLTSAKGALPGFAGSWRRHVYRQAQRLRTAIMSPDATWSGVTWR